eukprot:gene18825-20721_t
MKYANGITSDPASQNVGMKYNGTALNAVLAKYDRKIRPNTYGNATVVRVELKVMSFGPVSESSQSYDLEIFFRQWWTDPAIRGTLDRSLTMAIDIGDILWKPDTFFVNAIEAKFQYVTKDTMRVVLQPDGSVYYSARVTLKVSCPMHFSLFPMDSQRCPLLIESYSYTKEEVFYEWHESVGNLRKTKGVEWKAVHGPIFKLVNVESQQKQFSTNSKGSFSKLNVTFHLERRVGYYLWNTFLPSSFLVTMTWVNFWLPASAYPARVTVCVTSFFSTLLVMSNSMSQLARVSYVTAIDYFLMGNAIFIFLSLLEYVVVLHSWWDLPLKCWRKKKSFNLNSNSVIEKVNEAFDETIIEDFDKEGEESAENGVRKREVKFHKGVDESKGNKRERAKSSCSSLLSNDWLNANVIFNICTHKDEKGNPCRKCQNKDHLWYEKDCFVEHSFKETYNERIISFKSLQMKDSLFIWIGDSSNFDILTVATPTKITSLPSSTTILGSDTSNYHTAITQRLCKRLKKQILLSLNLNSLNEDLIHWVEQTLVKELEKYPEKF